MNIKELRAALTARDPRAYEYLEVKYGPRLRRKLTGSSAKGSDRTRLGQITEELVRDGVAEIVARIKINPKENEDLDQLMNRVAEDARTRNRPEMKVRTEAPALDEDEMDAWKETFWDRQPDRSDVVREVKIVRRWLGARILREARTKLHAKEQLLLELSVGGSRPAGARRLAYLTKYPRRSIRHKQQQVKEKVKEEIVRPAVEQLEPHLQVKLPLLVRRPPGPKGS